MTGCDGLPLRAQPGTGRPGVQRLMCQRLSCVRGSCDGLALGALILVHGSSSLSFSAYSKASS